MRYAYQIHRVTHARDVGSRLVSDVGRSGEVPVQVRVGSEMVLGWFQTIIKMLVQVSGWFQRSGVLVRPFWCG